MVNEGQKQLVQDEIEYNIQHLLDDLKCLSEKSQVPLECIEEELAKVNLSDVLSWEVECYGWPRHE